MEEGGSGILMNVQSRLQSYLARRKHCSGEVLRYLIVWARIVNMGKSALLQPQIKWETLFFSRKLSFGMRCAPHVLTQREKKGKKCE